MSTYTENYSLVKPGYGEQADVDVLNRLMTDKVDALLFENRRISADEYDQTETYAVGDYAIYENVLYKCLEVTTGNFDPSKWRMTNLAKELSTKGGADVTKTASGNPIEISDGASAPLVKCVTEIQGYQQGSGTPSPDNVRPIVAYTEGEIEVTKSYIEPSISNGAFTNEGTDMTLANRCRTEFISTTIGSRYKFSVKSTNNSKTAQIYVFWSTNNIKGSATILSGGDWGNDYESVCPSGYPYMRILLRYSDNSDVTVNSFSDVNIQQDSTTHTTTYPSAIYRGSEDCVNGEVKSEWGMIASYAGETLPGEWISDRDEYAPGTTPTTGAQVAYELATPTTAPVAVSNLPIKSLSGYNHIESSTGDMEVEYITGEYQPLVDLIEESSGRVTQDILYTASTMSETEIDIDLTAYDEYIIFANDVLITTQIPQGSTFPRIAFETAITNNSSIAIYGYDDCSCIYTATSNKLTYSSGRSGYRITMIIGVKVGTPPTVQTTSTRSLNLTKSAVEEIPDEIKNAEYEEKPDVNEADDDAPTEEQER